MSDNEESSSRSKAWIWVLVLVLITLLAVPFMAMGVALTKSGFATVLGRERTTHSSQDTNKHDSTPEESSELSTLRSSLEKAAAGIIKMPHLNPKMKEVKIQAPVASINKAKNEIQALLSDRHLQYVEGIENDRIRIIVIIQSKDWPELSGSLQMAAQQDGFIYQGPSQTVTAGDQADSMVAEIEILKKLGN